ncbi:hypothetical protein LBMAG33_4660 [Candidatus Levyibacteriota bacterium]|nr:hypothetical protein [Candidatus Levybacteria bacterium]MSU26198.1 hypothetical protein [Candidatus Levybacteria bacterium]GDX62156.1 hypothetical protein LBMAG33_4660 [Candidatus Levybacteria bacterium]
MKRLLTIFITLFILFSTSSIALAEIKESGSSAIMASNITIFKNDSRARILKRYLESYNSPLAKNANVFVREADRNNIDWRLVAAISGVESSYGKSLPDNSYNAWGWGIYGDNIIRFNSYDEAISTISKSLREQYMNKWHAVDVYAIGKIYASSPTWSERVEYFMMNIENQIEKQRSDTLSLSI